MRTCIRERRSESASRCSHRKLLRETGRRKMTHVEIVRMGGMGGIVEWSVTGWRGDLVDILGSDFMGGWELLL